MSWARIDDNMPDHPKVVEGGAAAELVAYRAICYANRYRTDGFVPSGALPTLIARLDGLLERIPPELIAERMADRLVAVGLWHKKRGGFLIHDYLDYNFSKAEIEAEKARNREAGKKSAELRATKRQQGVQHFLNPSPTPTPTTPPATRKETKASSRRSSEHVVLSDDQFITALRANPAYDGIDLDRELAKMDAYLLTPKARGRQKTRQFIVGWLNRIDRGMPSAAPFDPRARSTMGATPQTAGNPGVLARALERERHRAD